MPELYSVVIALLFAVLGGEIARRLKYPRIIGQLVISLVLAGPFLHLKIVQPEDLGIVKTLSEMGVILLLFLTGFDLDLAQMRHAKKDAFSIAFFAAIVPFVCGYTLGILLGMKMITAVVLGACLSLTAEGTKVALLLELKKIRTRVGSIMLGAGIIDDVFEILFLTIVLLFSSQESLADLWLFPVKILIFIAVVFSISRILPFLIHKLEAAKDATGLLTIMLLITVFFAIGSEYAGLGSVLGAFIGGILMQRAFSDGEEKEDEDRLLQSLAFSLIVPFFFLQIGLNFSLVALLEAPVLTLLVLLVALIGKIGGTMLTKPISSLSMKQLFLVGWGMNSRGVMELVIAQIALNGGLIDTQLYSVIVFMAIITTVIFPFAMQLLLKNDPNLMD